VHALPDCSRPRRTKVTTARSSRPGRTLKKVGSALAKCTWPKSTYIAKPPFFDGFTLKPKHTEIGVDGARALGIFGDSITTDHISPAGSIKDTSPAGKWLIDNKVMKPDFNSYGARRGNHEVMMRGTFANVRIKNLMIPPDENGTQEEGGNTRFQPGNAKMSIYDAAQKYMGKGVPTVIFGGEEYGTGSSRDWAAKAFQLLGVKAVIAKSFERIHRSNPVGMGALPLQFSPARASRPASAATRSRCRVRRSWSPDAVTLIVFGKDGENRSRSSSESTR
jgi:aconitate hydratase